MRKLLLAFWWYCFGFRHYYDNTDADCCKWCGYSFEDVWTVGNYYNTILRGDIDCSGKRSGDWYHLLTTCPRCYHNIDLELDYSL